MDKDYFILTLALGYGDGFLTYYSGAKIIINGVPAKVLGRVNMDMVQIGLDPKEQEKFQTINSVEIWSEEQETLTSFANSVKTIPYQVFTGITSRVTREYIRD